MRPRAETIASIGFSRRTVIHDINIGLTEFAYVHSVISAGYTPEPEPDPPPFSVANIMQMRVGAHGTRAKKVKKLAEFKPKFFNVVFVRIGVASRLPIEAHGNFDALDPNAVITILHKTFYS
jgi:hypothetical protein